MSLDPAHLVSLRQEWQVTCCCSKSLRLGATIPTGYSEMHFGGSLARKTLGSFFTKVPKLSALEYKGIPHQL